MMNKGYAFESFLPYRQALNLGRTVEGLLRLEIGFRKGCGKFDETLVSGIAFVARDIFPEIKPPEMCEEEFQQMRDREEMEKSMTEVERSENIERMARKIGAAIESGELDIWDETPRFIEGSKVDEFCNNLWSRMNATMVPSLKPGVGLLGDLVRMGAENLKTGATDRVRACRAGLAVWTFARMHHEGEPPYRIEFSSQVAEALGIDPVMEKIRAAKMPAPNRMDMRRMEAALAVTRHGAPELLASLQEALAQARITSSKASL